MALAESEAGTLAKAVVNVQQYYPMHISAKAMAWSNLVMVAGSIYGSRIVAVMVAKDAKEPTGQPTWRGSSGSVQGDTPQPPRPQGPFNPVTIPGARG